MNDPLPDDILQTEVFTLYRGGAPLPPLAFAATS